MDLQFQKFDDLVYLVKHGLGKVFTDAEKVYIFIRSLPLEYVSIAVCFDNIDFAEFEVKLREAEMRANSQKSNIHQDKNDKLLNRPEFMCFACKN